MSAPASVVQEPPILIAAIIYARMGWRVLPVHSPTPAGGCTCGNAGCADQGKHPRIKNWTIDATTDEKTIRDWFTRWPDANVGIATGRESGIIVLDVDKRHGGMESLAEMERKHGELQKTVTVRTGNGYHLYFRHPGGTVKNAVELGGLPGLDVRADGGFVVAPPSRHVSGANYLVEADPENYPLQDCAAFLAGDTKPSGNGNRTGGFQEGERNHALTSKAGAMRHAGLDREDIEAALVVLNGKFCNPPLPESEVRGIAKSIAGYPSGLKAATPCLVKLDIEGMLARGGWQPVPVLDDFLWAKIFAYLSGSAGSFKTWLMLHWAVALVTGQSFIRQAVHGDHRILFVECESTVQILQRLPGVCAAYGVSVGDVRERLQFFIPDGRPLRLEQPDDAAHLRQLAKDQEATWVFIDSLRRVTGLNENFAEDMAILADTAFLPLREAGHGVLVLEHPAKPMAAFTRTRKESMRGSGDKSAAADVVLHVEALETDSGRIAALSVAKCRLAPERDEPLHLQLRTREGGAVEFEEVEAPEKPTRGRPPTALERARNVIEAEKGRTPGLGFAEAVKACVSAGLSRATASRAWREVSSVRSL